MFVIRPCHVTTHENDDIGQNLWRYKAQTKIVLDEYQTNDTEYINEVNMRWTYLEEKFKKRKTF